MEKPRCLFKNSKHLADLNNMRLSGQFCDVTIKVNDAEFRAHKNILASNLKYFQSIFQENTQDVIIMKDIEGIDLEAFISFASTGEIEITDINAFGLLKVANHLNEDMVKQACTEFLEKNLNQKDACQVYRFAETIECISLKDTAISIILSNFGYCSRTVEYLEFDCECLKKILCKVLTSDSQQTVFEGIMRWMLHDVKNRQVHVQDLLSFIDMTKLAACHVMEYFSRDLRDKGDIAQNIMLFYHEKMQELKSLIMIGVVDEKLQMQFYDCTEEKWCRLREILDWNKRNTGTWIVSNNKFYYTSTKSKSLLKRDLKIYLEVFNLSDKRNRMLASDDRLLSGSAMCACSRFVYLCGGSREDYSCSNQVLRYDSETNSLDTLSSMRAKRSNATAIFYQGGLLVLGGYDKDDHLNSVEKYDPATKEWTIFPSMCEERSGHAVAVLDGKLYACGGDNTSEKCVEVFDPEQNSWQLVASMNKQRYIFLLIALEEKLLAIGGDEGQTIEAYDPSEDQWQMDRTMSSGMQKGSILGGGLISSCYANRHIV